METIETGAIRRILNELVPILEKYTLKFRDYCPLAMGALIHDQHTGPCTPSCFRNDIGYLFDIYDYDNCNSGGVLEEISSRGTSFSLGFSGKHELFKELDNDLAPVVPNDPGNVCARNLAELCRYAELPKGLNTKWHGQAAQNWHIMSQFCLFKVAVVYVLNILKILSTLVDIPQVNKELNNSLKGKVLVLFEEINTLLSTLDNSVGTPLHESNTASVDHGAAAPGNELSRLSLLDRDDDQSPNNNMEVG